MHFYDFNIGDYAKKTPHLTNDEDLAYRRLLDIYYDTEKPIAFPLDNDGLASLSRRLRLPLQSVKNVLDEFFPNGKNKHADEKISAYHLFLAKQSENGRKGGRPKNHIVTNTFENGNNPPLNGGKPTDNPVPSQPLTTKPLTTNQEPIETTPSPKPKKNKPTNPLPMVAGGDGFQVFWSAYPKKTGKVDAGKAWVKAKPNIDDVLKALEWQRVSAQWTKDGGQYIPNPSTYLNQGRWLDEPAKAGDTRLGEAGRATAESAQRWIKQMEAKHEQQ